MTNIFRVLLVIKRTLHKNFKNFLLKKGFITNNLKILILDIADVEFLRPLPPLRRQTSTMGDTPPCPPPPKKKWKNMYIKDK